MTEAFSKSNVQAIELTGFHFDCLNVWNMLPETWEKLDLFDPL